MREGVEKPFILRWSDYEFNLSERTHIMGVLNVTPDSFSDGGLYFETETAIEHGLSMAQQGADIIDVGGESARPYAQDISPREELNRVIPVIEALSPKITIPISIDSIKAEIVREALRSGASIVNDVSALRFDPEMAGIIAKAKVPVVLMHMKGDPKDMQDNPTYDHLIPEIVHFLQDAIGRAVRGGIGKEMIVIDPGIGFGKTFDDNLKIIRNLRQFHTIGRPLLLGTSRKAFLGHILDKAPLDRDTGTMATIAAGILNGAHIVRTHNVEMTLETVKVVDAIKNGAVR